MTDITNYPLTWPASKPRTPWDIQKKGTFSANGKKANVRGAVDRLMQQLEFLGSDNAILSTNVEVRLDGFPMGNRSAPHDTGVALYFDLDGKPHCMPCDNYTDVAQNITAIANHIDATRRIERYGVSSLAEMFTGFVALPAPEQAHHWTKVLDLLPTATKSDIKIRYRAMAKQLHINGAHENTLVELNVARDMALEEQ